MDANVCVAVPYRRLITDSKVKLKYQHLITNSFVEVRWPDIHWNATRRLLMYGLAYVWRGVAYGDLMLLFVSPFYSVIDC